MTSPRDPARLRQGLHPLTTTLAPFGKREKVSGVNVVPELLSFNPDNLAIRLSTACTPQAIPGIWSISREVVLPLAVDDS